MIVPARDDSRKHAKARRSSQALTEIALIVLDEWCYANKRWTFSSITFCGTYPTI
jgi:hypothetical protein